jgi:hypothetical protein
VAKKNVRWDISLSRIRAVFRQCQLRWLGAFLRLARWSSAENPQRTSSAALSENTVLASRRRNRTWSWVTGISSFAENSDQAAQAVCEERTGQPAQAAAQASPITSQCERRAPREGSQPVHKTAGISSSISCCFSCQLQRKKMNYSRNQNPSRTEPNSNIG